MHDPAVFILDPLIIKGNSNDPDNATAVSHNKENKPSRLELLPETEARQSSQAMPIQDDPDNANAVSHNKENEPSRLKLLLETEARQSLQAMPIQGNPNNAAAAQPVSSQGKDLLGKLCDVIAVQQELEAVKKQRDALLNEKEEWSKERIVLRGEVTNVYTKVKYNLNKFFPPSQVEHMLNGTCIRRWSDDDISKCIALTNLSPKAYGYLNEV
ncbi:uncharacterized protein LOC143037802 [Oratosquilla oratoria]|uniref:uncharacterized protein LOC143037802 n=1 Tax=Oratosquilla oratoria TaxID=337810 RepID=UPI003F76FD96